MKGRLVAVCAVCVLLIAASRLEAQWASLGSMPRPERQANSLTFKNAQGIVRVTALAPTLVRVRFSPQPAFGRDHSYSIVQQQFADPAARIDVAGNRSTISTAALRVVIRHNPFRIAFEETDGTSIDEDDPESGTAFSGRTVRVWKRLRDDEHVYGFGEKTGRLDKRGKQLGGYSLTMWNSDTYAYDSSIDPVYVSVPFFVVLRQGRAHGIFLDNTFRSNFDVGHTSQRLLSFGAEDGELNYYFVQGPSFKDVVSRYTELTGRMPMPPRWALGYQQCRYSYFPESRVRFIADNFRERNIPADVIWLDIHYQDGYKPFTWDPRRFPDPAGMLRDLKSKGFRVVTILDPHPKKEPGYLPYDSGVTGDHLVKNPDGSVFVAPVWPSNAETNPGPSVFPDFSKPAARDWWGELYRTLVDPGVAGIWNDMNEPAVFQQAAGTMPLDVRHDNEGQPTDHREIHNVYGLLMTRSTYEGLQRLRPNDRPFVLTRATFAGGQKYAAVWPGDNSSDWNDLRQSIPMLAGLGLSGFPFVGSDIGGFAEVPSAELYTRWLQCGVFYPFMRTHTTFGTPDQEPWSFGASFEALNRRAIELRYELLPQIYRVMHEAHDTGVPALRPMVLEYPEDPQTWQLDDQFMFGSDLLVAPVLREAAAQREVYLPSGTWHDFWTGRMYEGGRSIAVPVTLASIPIFVRGGAFVFRQPVVQHTGEMPGKPLIVGVYPAAESSAAHYEDDGESVEYVKGVFARRQFTQRRNTDGTIEITVSKADGRYTPAARALVVNLVGVDARDVTLPGQSRALEQASAEELEQRASGWTAGTDGSTTIKLPDTMEGVRIVVRAGR